MKDLTLIIPTKEESESLPIFLKELDTIDCVKLIVLQKEDLETKETIKEISNIQIVQQINNGYGNALIEGINATKTKYCCIINADGSMDPKYLQEMYKKCNDKDLIFASRYQKPGGGSNDDDGNNTIDAADEAACEAAGGAWEDAECIEVVFTSSGS